MSAGGPCIACIRPVLNPDSDTPVPDTAPVREDASLPATSLNQEEPIQRLEDLLHRVLPDQVTEIGTGSVEYLGEGDDGSVVGTSLPSKEWSSVKSMQIENLPPVMLRFSQSEDDEEVSDLSHEESTESLESIRNPDSFQDMDESEEDDSFLEVESIFPDSIKLADGH